VKPVYFGEQPRDKRQPQIEKKGEERKGTERRCPASSVPPQSSVRRSLETEEKRREEKDHHSIFRNTFPSREGRGKGGRISDPPRFLHIALAKHGAFPRERKGRGRNSLK